MYDVIIVGGGWGGICMMKHCLDEGLHAIVLEKSGDYGGVWNPTNTPSVLANTYSVTSKHYLSMSDFPIPDSYPEFPHHCLVLDYMRQYATHFNVKPHISLNSEVTHTEKRDGMWRVQYTHMSGTHVIVAKNLALCTGQNSVCKNYPDLDVSQFKGKIYHSIDYNETVRAECLNKRILIYGGSDTAFDMGVELTNNMYRKRTKGSIVEFGYAGAMDTISAERTNVYISMRKGRWFQRRTNAPQDAADMYYSRSIDTLIKCTSKRIVDVVFAPLLEFNWGKSGSGVPQWETNVGYLNSYYVKTADILTKITFGEITPLRDIKTVHGTSVTTVDDKTIDIDIILFATGYKGMACLHFIPANVKTGKYYDHLFLVEDPSVVKIGFIRPYLTSIPMLIEMQSRYVAKVFAGKISLPPHRNRLELYYAMKQRQSIEFGYDCARVEGIVDPYDYMNSIANKIHVVPSFVHLLVTDPYLWYYSVVHSWSHFVYRLTDPDETKRTLARKELQKLRYNGTSTIISYTLFTVILIIFCIMSTILYIGSHLLYLRESTPSVEYIHIIKK